MKLVVRLDYDTRYTMDQKTSKLGHGAIEMPLKEYNEYLRVCRAFSDWQDRIARNCIPRR
jgi:hypothetical protein